MNDLDYNERISILGLTISVTTIHNETFIGDIYYYGPNNRILILKEKLCDVDKFNFRYFNTKYIKIFKLISLKDSSEILTSLATPPIDIGQILKAESDFYENERKMKFKTNKKASEKAQKLFNEISRTYETIWDNQIIYLPVINVQIKPPYNIENCEGGDTKSLERIKTVLSKALKKISSE